MKSPLPIEQSPARISVHSSALPNPSHMRRIVMIAFDGAEMVDITGTLTPFATVNEILGFPIRPPYKLEIVADQPGPVRMSSGLELVANRAFSKVRGEIDTLLIPGGSRQATRQARSDSRLIRWLNRMACRARRIASVCTGAFILAEAGLLDGLKATTHWASCDELARDYPNVLVDPDPIYVRNGHIYTTAGVTAGMDLALALVEEDLGREWALAVAKAMVLYMKRPGGQSQFSMQLATQIQDGERIKGLPQWILQHVDTDLSIPTLAQHVGMSPRNFSRVFRKEVGMTPATFVEKARIDAARRRLEQSRLPLETVARETGFSSAEQMRRVFARHISVNPDNYRRGFRVEEVET